MRPDRRVPLALLCLALGAAAATSAQAESSTATTVQDEAPMTTQANGTFDVELSPQASDQGSEGITLGRMSIDKRFHGDLEATSKGEMLTAVTGVQGSAGYVAIERVRGTLRGRGGTFVLQHSSTMTRGAPQQLITVVPDSGTGELVGLSGTMTIEIADGKHFYHFAYALAETP